MNCKTPLLDTESYETFNRPTCLFPEEEAFTCQALLYALDEEHLVPCGVHNLEPFVTGILGCAGHAACACWDRACANDEFPRNIWFFLGALLCLSLLASFLLQLNTKVQNADQ